MALANETVEDVVKDERVRLSSSSVRVGHSSATLTAGATSTYATGGVTPSAAAIASMGLRSITNIESASADGYETFVVDKTKIVLLDQDAGDEATEISNGTDLATPAVKITIVAEGPLK